MSIRWIQNVFNDPDYYIKGCYDKNSLLKISGDIEKARQELKDLEQMVFDQYQKADLVTHRTTIESHREQNNYSSDKKVKINIKAYDIYVYEGREVKRELIYKSIKQFSYQEIKDAAGYIKSLLKEYPGATYENCTKYKQLSL